MSFSSIFRLVASDLKTSLRARSEAGVQEIAAPLQLRRGGFVAIDPLPFRMLSERVNFTLGALGQPVAARGEVDLGANTWLHRFYLDDDETWLQVKTDGGIRDEDVSECTIWRYWDVKTPGSQAELGQLAGPQSGIGLPSYTVGAYA
jgi:hypothetical protein